MTDRSWTITIGDGQTTTVNESESYDIDLDNEVIYVDGEPLSETRSARIAHEIARKHR